MFMFCTICEGLPFIWRKRAPKASFYHHWWWHEHPQTRIVQSLETHCRFRDTHPWLDNAVNHGEL